MKTFKEYFEKEEITEAKNDNITIIKDVLSGSSALPIKFNKGGQVTIDLTTANAINTVYEALKKPDMKKKFEEMLNTSKETFSKTLNFVWSMIK